MHVEDEALAAWLEGRLDAAARRQLHAHIDECGACRHLLVEAVRARSTPTANAADAAELTAGQQLGRYVVLSRLGAGSFGTVYEAFDPSLDRRVALKVLPVEDEERQLAEARTLARVGHLNSVGVFDVGVAHGCLFIAMELLEGGTLLQWLSSRPGWREIVERFVQAGRGLAAAHGAAVVHRDFKPANVLLDVSGRVCVADYGLAEAGQVVPALDSSVATPRSRRLVGTPAYLAPELISGEPASPASDQFAFCVALAEALGGQRPFAGETLAEVLDGIRARRVRPLPLEVSPGVARAVLRGLAPDPSARWPSMAALVEALEAAARPRRFAMLLLGAAALAVAVATGITFTRASPCAEVDAPVRRVWDDAARARIAAKFATVPREWAPAVERSTRTGLDGWTARWAEQRLDSCRATRVRLEQSEAALDLRAACLNRQLASLEGLVQQLTEGDETVLSRAPLAVAALPLLNECADLAALTERVPPPTDPTQRASALALEVDLARAGAFLTTGRFKDGVAPAAELVERATALGWRPNEGRALLLAGELAERTGAAETGELLSRAVLAATAGRDDEVAATALVAQLQDAAKRSDFERANRLEKEAIAAVERARLQVLPLGARLNSARGILADRAGRAPDAIALQRQALEILRRTYSEESAPVATTLNNLGAALVASHRYGEAREVLERAVAVRRRVLGEGHPDLASSLGNLGSALDGLGLTAEAIATQRTAAQAFEAGLGPAHPKTIATLINLALALSVGDATQRAEAVQLFERAAKLEDERSGGKPTQVLVTVYFGWAELLDALSRHEEALAIAEKALLATSKVEGAESLDAARAHDARGRALTALGRWTEAEASLRRALALEEKVLERDDVRLAYPLSGLSRVLVATGRARDAVVLLTRARALLRPEDSSPAERADLTLQLVKALAASGDRARARQVATDAWRDAADAGVSSDELRAFFSAP